MPPVTTAYRRRRSLDHQDHLPAQVEVAGPRRTDDAHLFTVDVEEYFQVSAFDRVVGIDQWETRQSRIDRGMDPLLELLGDHGYHGTFFVLGWVAERRPDLVRRIRDAGHEIASHGQLHRKVTALSPVQFREEVRRSKAILEEIASKAVLGYRAPSFSLVPGREWALDILLEEGYRYDSSLFPIRRPGYGHPGAAPTPHWIQRLGGALLEVPPATIPLGGIRLPAAGGAYFRHFPYLVTRRALRQRQPAVVYLHPWELDPDQPRISSSLLTRIRHHGGLRHTLPRLRRLLREFRFTSIDRYFGLSASLRAAAQVGQGSEP